MRRSSLIRRVQAALILPLVLFVSAGPDGILFRCRHDHVARWQPCCPDELSTDDDATLDIAVQEDRCCEPGQLNLVHDASLTASAVSPDAVLPLLVVQVEPFVSAGLAHALAAEAHRSLNTGPPVLLKTRSLLI